MFLSILLVVFGGFCKFKTVQIAYLAFGIFSVLFFAILILITRLQSKIRSENKLYNLLIPNKKHIQETINKLKDDIRTLNKQISDEQFNKISCPEFGVPFVIILLSKRIKSMETKFVNKPEYDITSLSDIKMCLTSIKNQTYENTFDNKTVIETFFILLKNFNLVNREKTLRLYLIWRNHKHATPFIKILCDDNTENKEFSNFITGFAKTMIIYKNMSLRYFSKQMTVLFYQALEFVERRFDIDDYELFLIDLFQNFYYIQNNITDENNLMYIFGKWKAKEEIYQDDGNLDTLQTENTLQLVVKQLDEKPDTESMKYLKVLSDQTLIITFNDFIEKNRKDKDAIAFTTIEKCCKLIEKNLEDCFVKQETTEELEKCLKCLISENKSHENSPAYAQLLLLLFKLFDFHIYKPCYLGLLFEIWVVNKEIKDTILKTVDQKMKKIMEMLIRYFYDKKWIYDGTKDDENLDKIAKVMGPVIFLDGRLDFFPTHEYYEFATELFKFYLKHNKYSVKKYKENFKQISY